MRWITLLLTLVLWLGAPLESTTLLPMNAADLVDQAELIFLGTAAGEAVATTKDGKYPYTFVTFEVSKVLKGRVEGARLTLRFEGGEVGDEYVLVHGIPQFEQGHEYLLFVANNGEAISPVVGWGQGQLELLPHPSLQGEQVLVDYQGNAIEGIAHGEFLRSPIERDEHGLRRQPSPTHEYEVLVEDGVTISDPDDEAISTADQPLLPARAVFQGLTRSLKARATEKSFRPGKLVRSLTIDDVPDTFSYYPTDSGRQ